MLAQQIQSEALRRGSHGGLLAEVCGVLEAPPGGSEGSTGSMVPPGGPSTFQVSSAVAAMFARVDWPRLRRSSGGACLGWYEHCRCERCVRLPSSSMAGMVCTCEDVTLSMLSWRLCAVSLKRMHGLAYG